VADASLTHGVWLERVPELVAECVDEWGLQLGEPYEAGAAGYAVRAVLPDGTPAVLKLIFPHREAEHEAQALALWTATERSGCSPTTRDGGRC
jgi:streptomycin 6-kinase